MLAASARSSKALQPVPPMKHTDCRWREVELVVVRIVPSLARTYASSASAMLREDRLREESCVDEVRPEEGRCQPPGWGRRTTSRPTPQVRWRRTTHRVRRVLAELE